MRGNFHLLDLIHNIKLFSFGDLEVISESVVNLGLDIIKHMCREDWSHKQVSSRGRTKILLF